MHTVAVLVARHKTRLPGAVTWQPRSKVSRGLPRCSKGFKTKLLPLPAVPPGPLPQRLQVLEQTQPRSQAEAEVSLPEKLHRRRDALRKWPSSQAAQLSALPSCTRQVKEGKGEPPSLRHPLSSRACGRQPYCYSNLSLLLLHRLPRGSRLSLLPQRGIA